VILKASLFKLICLHFFFIEPIWHLLLRWSKVIILLLCSDDVILQQLNRLRMESYWTVTSWDITAKEADSTLELDEMRHHWRYLLSTEKWLQLGRFAERPAAVFNGVLALAFSGEKLEPLNNWCCLAWTSAGTS
jgi:hypothetical protein